MLIKYLKRVSLVLIFRETAVITKKWNRTEASPKNAKGNHTTDANKGKKTDSTKIIGAKCLILNEPELRVMYMVSGTHKPLRKLFFHKSEKLSRA